MTEPVKGCLGVPQGCVLLMVVVEDVSSKDASLGLRAQEIACFVSVTAEADVAALRHVKSRLEEAQGFVYLMVVVEDVVTLAAERLLWEAHLSVLLTEEAEDANTL